MEYLEDPNGDQMARHISDCVQTLCDISHIASLAELGDSESESWALSSHRLGSILALALGGSVTLDRPLRLLCQFPQL